MKKTRKVLVARASQDLNDLLDGLARDLPDIDFETAPPGVQLSGLNGRAVASSALVVEIDLTRADALESFGAFTAALGDRKVIAAARNAGLAEVRSLFRAGAADVLTAPFSTEALRVALAEVLDVGKADAASRGRVVSILKTGGGAGATTVAVNLAVCAAGGGRRSAGKGALSTALLDLDLQFGDAEAALNLDPRSTVLEVLRDEARLDAQLLQGAMVTHSSGVRLLAASPRLIPLDALTPSLASQIVEKSARLHERTFVDLPQAWTDWSLAVLKASDAIVLVSSPTVQGALGARRALDALREAKVEAPVLFVLNKLAGLVEAFERPSRIGRTLDCPIDASLSLDPVAARALERGAPVVEGFQASRLARELRSLSAKVEQAVTPPNAARIAQAGAAA